MIAVGDEEETSRNHLSAISQSQSHSYPHHLHSSSSPSHPTLQDGMDTNDVVELLRQTQVYDYLRVTNDAELRKFLYNASRKAPGQKGMNLESVQFSDLVTKINRKN